MIETTGDCTRFQRENQDGDWFVYIVPVEEDIHPTVNHPSILFIRNLSTKKTYWFAFEHPDSIPTVPHAWFVNDFLLKSNNHKWTLDTKAFRQMLNLPDMRDANLASHLQHNEIFDLVNYETPAHFLVRKNSGGRGKVNLAIPLMKHKEMFDEIADDVRKVISKYEPDNGFFRFDELVIGTLGRLEQQGIFVDREMFRQKYNIDVGLDGITHSQYNVYTSTGRPSNRFGGVNYAALNQTDGTRKCFRSRYGQDGRMVVVDYTTFHPRIICHLTKYQIPVEIDIYEYLAKLYFQKKEIDETDIKNAKQLTFRQFFGGVENDYSHIKYLSNLKLFIDTQWDFFQNNGYVLTPLFGRKITKDHIIDPNPPKVFNYILQATEGEVSIPRVKTVLEYLQDKKTKAVLYTYDAVLYDFHKDDGYETLKEIRRIMSFDGMFPMKTYIGETYHDVRLISL
ncbi:MAG: hypothetical protein V1769_03780 [Thermoplasmatota archaeon]